MFLTHTNSVYTEEITLLDHIPYPQYVHQISDGGVVVKEGIKSMPGELIDYVLNGKHGADYGTAEFIHEIVKIPNRKIGLILSCRRYHVDWIPVIYSAHKSIAIFL